MRQSGEAKPMPVLWTFRFVNSISSTTNVFFDWKSWKGESNARSHHITHTRTSISPMWDTYEVNCISVESSVRLLSCDGNGFDLNRIFIVVAVAIAINRITQNGRMILSVYGLSKYPLICSKFNPSRHPINKFRVNFVYLVFIAFFSPAASACYDTSIAFFFTQIICRPQFPEITAWLSITNRKE